MKHKRAIKILDLLDPKRELCKAMSLDPEIWFIKEFGFFHPHMLLAPKHNSSEWIYEQIALGIIKK